MKELIKAGTVLLVALFAMPAVVSARSTTLGQQVEKRVTTTASDAINMHLLYDAAFHGRLDIIEYFVEHGADINAKTTDEFTPLHKAAEKGHLDTVKYLVENGADINAKTTAGYTPLHGAAATYRHLDTVKYLVENGADINAKDERGETPLWEAAFDEHLDVVKYLEGKGGKR